MERVFNKLVRDNIPTIIENNGEQAFTEILNDVDYEKELLKKLEEETKEVVGASSKVELLEELADVYEVLKSLAELHSLTTEDIERVALEKRNKRGGFSKRIYLKSTK